MLSHTLHIVLATLRQDLRTHSLRLLILCLGLAVGAIAAVLMVADRFEASFKSESAALLGADWVLNSDSAPKPQLLLDARAAGLKATQTVVFGSMGQIKMLPDPSVNTGDAQKLVSVKAVEADYPLRGALTLLKVGSQSDQNTEKTSAVPARGTVWMDADVWATANGAMTVQVGQTMTLGTREFKIARFIALEPDRGVQFASFAPRVMINAADLPETGLLTLGARATYRVLVSGTPEQIKQWDATQKSQLQRGQRIETLEEGRPEMRTALTRASKFLALIAVFTALIAATGVWVAAGQYATGNGVCLCMEDHAPSKKEAKVIILKSHTCTNNPALLRLGRKIGRINA